MLTNDKYLSSSLPPKSLLIFSFNVRSSSLPFVVKSLIVSQHGPGLSAMALTLDQCRGEKIINLYNFYSSCNLFVSILLQCTGLDLDIGQVRGQCVVLSGEGFLCDGGVFGA